MNKEKILSELESYIENLEVAATSCSEQVLKINEAQDELSAIKNGLQGLLPRDSKAFRVFERMSKEVTEWWQQTASGYVSEKDCKYLNKWIEILRAIANEFEPEFLRPLSSEKKQIFFSAGEEFRAKKEIFSLMKRATTKLDIVDTYMDDSIFDYIGSLDETIKIRLITGNRIKIFPRLYVEFIKIKPSVDARENIDSHDRYIIIDNQEIWHLGASINHAGKKATMINKIIDKEQKSEISRDIELWWDTGSSFT